MHVTFCAAHPLWNRANYNTDCKGFSRLAVNDMQYCNASRMLGQTDKQISAGMHAVARLLV